MKKTIIASSLICASLLALSGCGNDQKEKDMQSTIDSQNKQIETLKKDKEKIENEKQTTSDELKKANDANKKKDEEIKKLKKVLASKKANNQQTAATSTQQTQTSTQQSTVEQQANTNQGTTSSSSTPQFANEAEAEAYYDSLIDHEARAREAAEKKQQPALTQDGQKIYDEYGNVLSEAERQEAIDNGQGDPVVQYETAQKQLQWAKEHGLVE